MVCSFEFRLLNILARLLRKLVRERNMNVEEALRTLLEGNDVECRSCAERSVRN